MSMFSRRDVVIRHYCQAYRDLSAEEVNLYSSPKKRATCHVEKGHQGDHEDKVLGLAWGGNSWPRTEIYPAESRENSTKAEPVDIQKFRGDSDAAR